MSVFFIYSGEIQWVFKTYFKSRFRNGQIRFSGNELFKALYSLHGIQLFETYAVPLLYQFDYKGNVLPAINELDKLR